MEIKKLMDWRGILSLLSISFGIIFYVLWSSTYNSWMDISSYSVAVPFILLGLFGVFYLILE